MTEEKTNGKQSHNLPYYPPNHRFVPFSADGGNGSPRTNPSRADVFHQTFKMRDQKQSYHRHPLPPQFSSHRFVPFSADGGSGGPRSNPSRADVFHQTFERRNQKQSYHRHPLPPQFSSHRFVPFSADGGNGSPRTNPSRADVFHQTFKMRDQKQSYHRHPLPPHRANLRYVQPMFSGQGGSEDIRMNPSHTDVLPQSWTPGYQNQFSRIPAQARGSIHVPHVNMQPQESAFSHSGFKRTIASWGKTRERPEPKRRKARKRSTCLWCGSICENGLPRHIQENCEDGLFRAACDVIHMMFGKSGVRVTKLDIKTAHAQIMKCPDFKSELITRIRKQMSKRITTKLEHTVRAPRSNGSAFKTFQGLDAMVSVFFWLFGFKMPVEAELVSYDFTCFDADISADVKRFIFKWVQMTQKTARRDALNAITHTSQDPLSIGDCNVVLDVSPEGWKALENEEYEFLHHESDLLEDIGSMVKEFELRLLRKYPTEKFAWLRCFLVAFRAFSVEALELKTLPDGEVRYRTIKSDERKEILGSMSTFVMQNYDTLVKSFRDVVESQYNATELRLQLLRAFLAMPSDRRASDLTTLAEGLVRRLSEDIPHGFSSEFGDVPQIIFPGYYVPSKTLFIDKLAQADLCHIVHVHGSRASRMCLVDSNKGTLEPISEGQNSLHSTALDLFINNGLNAKAVLSLPDFIKYQTLRITSNEQWKAMTKFASRFATLDTLIITKCASTVLEIGTMKCFRDLRCLSLVQNHISTLQPAVFNHFTGLEKLDLSFNGLKTIPPGVFNVCKSLQEVYLDKNEICTLSPRGFEGLSNLKILILRSNKLHSLPEGVFHGLESLETLSLWANQLQSLPVKLFQTVKSLKELRLGQNQLQSLDQGTFDDLKFLETLALYNNKLKGLPVGLFQKLKYLYSPNMLLHY
ncbi:hypothetical protein AAMO2058_001145300 [Amorphochlora amoebiformis]